MKKILISLSIIFTLFLGVSCSDYLNVNNNVDTPDEVVPNLRLAPILCGFVSNYYDLRSVGCMSQYFSGNGTGGSTFGAAMSYPAATDYAEVWKMVYYEWGQNLEDMINQAKVQKQPLYAGIGLALKAYGWYELTSIHGEAPCKEFLDPGRTVFDYDSQEYILSQSRMWAQQAIAILSVPDATVYPASITSTDLMYKGDRTKWLKFAYGVLAKNYMTMSSTATIDQGGIRKNYLDSAINAVNSSMVSYGDDATVMVAGGTNSVQCNFWGVLRGNLTTSLTQTDYMVDLETGKVKLYDANGNTVTTGNVTQLMAKQYITDTLTLDPRSICYFGTTDTIPLDLTKINVKTYKFVGTLPGQASQVTLQGTTAAPSAATSGTGRWLFRDNAPYIVMTYAELQFIKAEAQFRKGDAAGALATFKGAVAASMQTTATYIVPGTAVKGAKNKMTSVIGDKIPAATFNTLSTAYLNSQYVNGMTVANFELAHIMMQKYVALYPWGLDTWNDLRRYQYDLKVGSTGIPSAADGSWTAQRTFHKADIDPTRVYKGFYLASADVSTRRGTFVTANLGSPSYRVLPRYNSEYIWNVSALAALKPISGLAANYNTSMVWFCLTPQ